MSASDVRAYAGVVVGLALVGVYLFMVVTGAVPASEFVAVAVPVIGGYFVVDNLIKRTAEGE